jgi:hypothetical protein
MSDQMPGTIYVDARLLFLGGVASATERLGPDVATALGHLSAAGHRLVVVGHGPRSGEGQELPVEWSEELGQGPGWWLAAERPDCGGARAVGLRARPETCGTPRCGSSPPTPWTPRLPDPR